MTIARETGQPVALFDPYQPTPQTVVEHKAGGGVRIQRALSKQERDWVNIDRRKRGQPEI
jgi:hypothetical protein